MKKYIFVLLYLFVCYLPLSAQEYEYIDSLESVQINIKADFDSTYGSLNISYLPVNNILIDKTLWLVQPESYNGTANSNIRISITNLLGEKIASVVNDLNHKSGVFTKTFDVSKLPQGLYYCTLTSPFSTINKSFMVVR